MFRLARALLLTLALIGGAAHAETHIRTALIAESDRPAAGAAVTLAIAMTPEPGWHGYWSNPGDAGLPDRFAWTLPPGAATGPVAYPVPGRFVLAGLMNHVYRAPYALLVTLRLPAGLAMGTRLPIRLKLEYLVCSDQLCVPETADLALGLTIGDAAIDPARRTRFDGWRAALPRPLGGDAHFTRAGGTMRIAVPLPAAAMLSDPWFFAQDSGAVDYAAPQHVTRSGDTLIVETKAGSGTPDRVAGVLAIGGGTGLSFVATPGAVPADGEAIASPAQAHHGAATILLALGGAILGGLLLNIMPCVFPILSLKALSLARVGGDERQARREGIAYAAGVVLVCVALGGLLLGLRASGAAAGWAFQLQDARVVLVLLLLVVAIALNLAGLFELGVVGVGEGLARGSGARGAFWTGALAAFVATPCTGPFMGAALGAAVVLPWAAALAIFAGLGIGLALPFLLLGFSPWLRARLPRPGAWMDTFRRILAVPMFVTALWLAWVLGRQAGVDAMTLGLVAALVVGLGLWWVGRRQRRGSSRAWAPLIPALLLAITAVALVPKSAATVASSPGALAAEPFSESRLSALRAAHRPVFVYFTADWCLTCKVNEASSIDRAEVATAFAKAKVAVLVGDWTRGDPAISRFLGAHGRSGVPLYLFYEPGGEATELPQVLTPGRLVALAR